LFEDSATIEGNIHELLHLYGAQDFYLIDEVKEAAEIYLPCSVMGSDEQVVKTDDLTAYIVGWTAELSGSALQFLDATAHLTMQDKYDALEQTWQSGLVVLQEEKEVLKNDILILENYFDKYIRETHHYSKPGEVILKFD
jgi:hypothetical protein